MGVVGMRSAAAAVGILGAVLGRPASGADRSETLWLAPHDGSWIDASEWTNGAPSASQTAVFGALPGSGFVVAVGWPVGCAGMRFTTQGPVLELGGGASLALGGNLMVCGPSPTIAGGTLEVEGTLQIANGSLTLEGTSAMARPAGRIGSGAGNSASLVLAQGASLTFAHAIPWQSPDTELNIGRDGGSGFLVLQPGSALLRDAWLAVRVGSGRGDDGTPSSGSIVATGSAFQVDMLYIGHGGGQGTAVLDSCEANLGHLSIPYSAPGFDRSAGSLVLRQGTTASASAVHVGGAGGSVGELRVESGSVLSLAPSGTLYLGLMGPGDAIFDHAGGATMGSLRIGGSEAGSAGSIVARASLLEPGLLAVSPRPDALPELQLEAGGRIACQTGSLGHGVDIVAEVALDAPPLIAASEWLYVAGSLHLTFPDGPPRPNTWHTLFAAPTYVGIPSLETEPPGAGIVLWQPGRLAFFAPPPTSMLTIAPSAISLGVGQGAALATSLDTGSETLDVTWVTGWSVDPPSLASVAGSIPTIIGLTPGVGTLTASLSNGMHASAAISVAPSGLPASPSRRLSLPSTSEAFAASIEPRVSPDGRYVSFSTWALSLGALSTGTHEVVVLDRLVGTTELVSVHATIPPPWGGWSVGAWPSDAAQRIAFTSSAASITGESGLEGPHPYLRDRVNGTTLRLDQRIDGTIPTGSGAVRGISDDGFRILFDSNDPLLVEGDAGETWDVFLADVERGTLQRISLPAPGVPSTPGATSRAIALAADGSTILFASTAALVADDTNGVPDLYLFEASAGSLERIGDGWPSEDLDAVAEQATLSPDGSTIALATTRQLLPNDSDQLSDLYVYRRDTAALTLPIPEAVATEPFHPQLSPDGTSIAFVTESPLTTSDTNGAPDVYRAMAPDWWPEPIALGFGDSIANSGARSPFLLRDGSGIPFQSNSTNLAIPDNAAPDVYLRGLAAASGDLDGDRDVDSADLALLLGAWGSTTGDLADLDGDGVVGGADLVLLLEQWTL